MQRNKLRLLIATSLLLVPVALHGQQVVERAADPGHAASGFHRKLFGNGYRDVWTVPIQVPVLNLDTFAGGLTAFREGGNQSRTLRFRAGNGKVYHFRSTRKFLPRNLPDDVKDTPAGNLIHDQSSAMHPTGHLVVAGLQQPVGVLQPIPRLVVLPDHPRLGEFRKTFAGMMGQIEERPQDFDDNEKLNFAGAEKVQDATKLLENLEASMEFYLDQRDWLRVRLIDFLAGDTDRGGDQWEYARFDAGDRKVYRPVPKDRDYSFMHSDGMVIRMVAMAYPKLVLYNERFAKLKSYLFMTREFDRSHLNALTWNDWQTIIRDVQMRLTDRVIDEAVMRMPPQHRELSGAKLASALRARRNNLDEYAKQYYNWINEEVDIFGSDERERADIERHTDGSVTVRIYREGAGGDVAAGTNGQHAPAFDRRFVPDETSEIRVFLDRGNDRAVVRGVTDYTIDVRVIGGEGDDVLVDSTDVSRGGTFTTFYDASGRNTIVTSRHTRVSTKPFVTRQPIEPEPEPGDEKKQPRSLREERRGRFQDLMNTGEGFIAQKTKAQETRSWGQKVGMVPAVELREGSGVIVGVGYGMTDYGFRRIPYESRFVVTPMVSPTTGRLGARILWDMHPENSKLGYGVLAHATQFESNRFFGWGNESPFEDFDGSLVRRTEISIHPRVSYRFDQGSFLSVGPLARRTSPHIITGSVADTLFSSPLAGGNDALLGAETAAQLGGRLDLVLNTTDLSGMPRSGFVLRSGITGFASELDCDSLCTGTYYNAHASVANYLSIGNSILALRVGGSKVFGDNYPLHDAAFIGGQSTLRGYHWNRFAGDAAAFGGAELRVPLTRAVIFTRGDLGVLALADAGRVWFDDDSPGGWHTGVGVGLWFHTIGSTVSVSYAKGEDAGRFYFKLGPAF